MDAKFIQRGDSIDFRPERDVAAGEVVPLSGKLVGIAKLDIKAGELGSLSLTGVFDMPKALNWGIGRNAKVTWDPVARNVKGYIFEGGIPLGFAETTSQLNEPRINVRLCPGMRVP